MLISRSGDPPKVILITSGSPGEGKSTVSLNLAASFAQYSKKVLLVEGDLRRPTLARRLGIKEHTGLSVLLSDQTAHFEPVLFPQQPNLDLLFAGPTPPYPAEMLGSVRMKQLMDDWQKDYDFVLIDSPPVLPVTDAQILAAYADAIVLIVRVGVTSRVAAKRAASLLIPHAKNADSPNVGVVVNSISTRSAAYYGYYGYYGGQKYEYTSHSEKPND
jgi:capsular exopolysaccharide synthesis family protein